MKKEYRLRKTAEFQRVRAERRGAAEPLLRLQVRPNGLEHPRVGIAVSRKVGGAVQRNRLRRRLRAAAAAELQSLQPFDLVLIPRPDCGLATYQQLASSLRRATARAGVRASR